MASYKGTYSSGQSINITIPVMIILALVALYVMSQTAGYGFVSFILIGAAAVTMIYWGKAIKKIIEERPKHARREAETKNWVYDLIKGNDEFVFVAEVPGPEDVIMIRLIEGILYIRGGGGFAKEVPIEGSIDMQVHDFKYRNGVLTLRIRRL